MDTSLAGWSPFDEWRKTLFSEEGIVGSGSATMEDLKIGKVDWFGSRVGMARFDVTLSDTTGERKWIVNMKSHAVAALVVARVDGEDLFVAVEQNRAAVGKKTTEIVAGLHEGGNFLSSVLQELVEEANISLSESDLRFLGKAWPSTGACNEEVNFFFCRVEDYSPPVERTGNAQENESIRVKMCSFEELAGDGKFLMAWSLAKKKGLL